jgi:hypothetical protein
MRVWRIGGKPSTREGFAKLLRGAGRAPACRANSGPLAGLPVTRSGGSAVFYRGLILDYGGECLNFPSRIAYDQFEAYDPKTDRWSPLAKAPATMHAQAGAVAGDTAYFLGGSTSCGSDKPSLAVYAFRLN